MLLLKERDKVFQELTFFARLKKASALTIANDHSMIVENDKNVDGDLYQYGEVNDDGEDDDEDQTLGCVSDGSGVVLRRKPTKGCTCM